jgi:hypothetical protein
MFPSSSDDVGGRFIAELFGLRLTELLLVDLVNALLFRYSSR